MIDERRDWIVWDGACGFCRRAVDWALARDRDRRFLAVPNHDVPPEFVTPERDAAFRDAVHVRTAAGEWLRGGRACLYVLERIGFTSLARIARVPPLVRWSRSHMSNRHTSSLVTGERIATRD